MAFIFCILIATLAQVSHAEETLAFIVNKDNPAASISETELKDYFFKRKTTWKDGTIVRFIDRKDSPERKLFLSKYLQQTADEVDLYWIGQKLYSGNSAPVQAASEGMVIQFVASFRGAIGFISSGKPPTNDKVKIIRVDQ